jgi:hypothetical protein
MSTLGGLASSIGFTVISLVAILTLILLLRHLLK